MTAAPAARPRTYVLDTSVLLSDPSALHAFQEHDIVLPLPVISELEAKRNHPELGWAARRVLQRLEALRVENGQLTAPVEVTEAGGTLRVEMNHRDLTALPAGLRRDTSDARILAVAANLAAEGADRHAGQQGPSAPAQRLGRGDQLADDYRRRQAVDTGWTGVVRARGAERGRSTGSSTSASLDVTELDAPSPAPACATCRSTPVWCCRPAGARARSAGSAPTSAST